MNTKRAENALINAKIELKMLKKQLKRQLGEFKNKETTQKKELVKLMKEGGDPVIIDMKTKSLSNTLGQIRKISMNQARLDMFSDKIDEAHIQQKIGQNMVQVSTALKRVTNSMQLEKIEGVMMDLGKQYEDIDVMTSVLDTSTTETTADTTSPEEIMTLQKKLADEAGLELSNDLQSAGAVETGPVRNEPSEERLALQAARLKVMRQHAT